MNRLLSLTCVGLLASTFATAAADDLFEDKVLVRGTDFEITDNELSRAYLQRKAQMAAQGRSIPEHLRLEVEKQTLDLLILKNALLNMATEAEAAEAKKLVEEQTATAPPEMLGQQATLLGLTNEEFMKELIDQNTASLVVNREFKPKVNITEEQSRKFYDDNPTNFEAPEMVKASHILIAIKTPAGQDLSSEVKKEKRELADKVLARAKAGEDFDALIKEYSEDPGVVQNGGTYTFRRGQMVPPFETAAWSLEPNAISGIVTTDFGYHIIKKLESLPARVQEFAEVEESIGEYLGGKELQDVLQDYISEMKKDPSVQILSDKYK